jgi:hypothetical protein
LKGMNLIQSARLEMWWKAKKCERKEMPTPYAGERSTCLKLGTQMQKGIFLDTSPILTPTSENQNVKLFLKF